MNRKTVMATLLLVSGGFLAGCSPASDDDSATQDVLLEDHAGVSFRAAEQLSLEEHYQVAGDRYVELNELFGELQTEISADEWVDNGGRVEIVPGQGNTLGRAPAGTTRDNSYFFKVNRWQETERDLSAVLAETAQSWQERGWEVSQQDSQAHPDVRIPATTDSGYWFAVEEDQAEQRVVLRGQSPVYWGPLDEMQGAIVERAAAEEAAGETWDTEDRDDETGQAIRQPGEYRPFPAWDALEDYTPESIPPPEWKTRK